MDGVEYYIVVILPPLDIRLLQVMAPARAFRRICSWCPALVIGRTQGSSALCGGKVAMAHHTGASLAGHSCGPEAPAGTAAGDSGAERDGGRQPRGASHRRAGAVDHERRGAAQGAPRPLPCPLDTMLCLPSGLASAHTPRPAN